MLRAVYFVMVMMWLCSVNGQTLQLHITNIRNKQGNLRLQFFDSETNFDAKNPLFTKIVSKQQVLNGTIQLSYSGLKPGTYGIAILDDENGNQKMDYGILLPKEGFGFSNYYHSSMTQPKFKDFSFVLAEESKVILLKLRYL